MSELEEARENLREAERELYDFNMNNRHIFNQQRELSARRAELSRRLTEVEKKAERTSANERAARVQALLKSDAERQDLQSFYDAWTDETNTKDYIFISNSGVELSFDDKYSFFAATKPRLRATYRNKDRSQRKSMVDMYYVKAGRRGEVFVEDVVVFPKEALEE